MTTPRFIIYSSRYNENVGGVIALHRLCHLINILGYKASIYLTSMPSNSTRQPLSSFGKFAEFYLKCKLLHKYTNPSFISPVATRIDPFNDIVIYPEVVAGNPLSAKKVVRWFLHKPGFHTGQVDYGDNELYFYYQQFFNDTNYNKDWDNKLRVLYLFDDVYKQKNFGVRRGSCYILRKGAHKKLVHDTANSVLIDGLSHKQAASIFNQVETCISYDTKTLYSQYAAMCGCKSIIIPDEGVDIEQWQPEIELRSGVAYGFDDVDRAEATKPLLFDMLVHQQEESLNDTKNFVHKCLEHYC